MNMDQVGQWLMEQAPAIVIAFAVIGMLFRMIRRLQNRIDSLSDALTRHAELASAERLDLTRRHADERERLRTEMLLQHDATLRNILASLEQGLLQRLGKSEH